MSYLVLCDEQVSGPPEQVPDSAAPTSSSPTIELAPESAREPANAEPTLTTECLLSVVAGDTGLPLLNARIECEDTLLPRVSNHGPGVFAVSFRAPKLMATVACDGYRPETLEFRSDVKQLSISMTPYCSVSGRIASERPEFPSGLSILAEPIDSVDMTPRHAPVNSDGRFAWSTLELGRSYRLVSSWSQQFPSPPYRFRVTSRHQDLGEFYDLQRGELEVVVHKSNGEIASDASVKCGSWDEDDRLEYFDVAVDRDGIVTLYLRVDLSHRLAVDSPFGTFKGDAFEVSNVWDSRHIYLDESPSISGYVISEHGEPLENVDLMAHMTSKDGSPSFSFDASQPVKSAHDGFFRISDVVSGGLYELTAFPPSGFLQDSKRLESSPTANAMVVLRNVGKVKLKVASDGGPNVNLSMIGMLLSPPTVPWPAGAIPDEDGWIEFTDLSEVANEQWQLVLSWKGHHDIRMPWTEIKALDNAKVIFKRHDTVELMLLCPLPFRNSRVVVTSDNKNSSQAGDILTPRLSQRSGDMRTYIVKVPWSGPGEYVVTWYDLNALGKVIEPRNQASAGRVRLEGIPDKPVEVDMGITK